jgi:glycosyltransferase involved in cell wall biosynthesis
VTAASIKRGNDSRVLSVLMLNPAFSGGGYMHGLCNALADAGCYVELHTGPHYVRTSRSWKRIAYHPRIRFYRHTQLRSYETRGPVRLFWRGLRLVGHLWSMTRVLAAVRRFDVVHVHFLSIPRLDLWWLRAIARHVPTVCTVHNLYPHDFSNLETTHRIFQRIYAVPHVLVAHTDHTVEGLVQKFHVPPEKITKIAFGNANHLRDQRGVPTPAEAGLDLAGPPIIMMFGDLRHNKGVDVLLRAAALLRDNDVSFRVLIAGAPSVDPRPYLELAHALRLGGNVEFRLAYVDEAAVTTYFRAATIMALPYRTIDQSLVAISAMSLGRALVATRIAGLEETIGQAQAGLLVPVDDPQATADAIKRLLTDEALRRRCEANGRRFADAALAWEPIAARTIDLYRKCIARHQQSGDGSP